jgi:hypothetical protein
MCVCRFQIRESTIATGLFLKRKNHYGVGQQVEFFIFREQSLLMAGVRRKMFEGAIKKIFWTTKGGCQKFSVGHIQRNFIHLYGLVVSVPQCTSYTKWLVLRRMQNFPIFTASPLKNASLHAVLGEYLLNMTSVFESVIVEKISNSLACKTIKL